MNANVKAFMYFYKSDAQARTEYIYIIAVTEKQANYFWYKYRHDVLGTMFDYSITPCGVKECNFPHEIGSIFGQYANI